MPTETLPLFALAIFVLAILPGPGVFLTVARAISGGFKHALLTIAGILMGDLIFILLVTLGLKIIADSLTILFIAIKYIGGVYLIWLGLTLLLSKPEALVPIKTNRKTTTYIADFLAGLTVTLSNPKAIFFYLSFLPAFVDIQTLTALDIIIISVMVAVILGSVMLFYALTAIKTQKLAGAKSSNKWIKKIAGGLILSTGGILITRS
jgi:threonine/homoserine/homoserine lactone efflux protein